MRARYLCAAILGLGFAAGSASALDGEHLGGGHLNGGYAIVVSKSTAEDLHWKPVVKTLLAKHQATVFSFEKSPRESLAALQKSFPRYLAFVAKPEEATREFVAEVSRLACQLDEDPYVDAFWGIVTGYNAEGALRMAQEKEPLVIRRVAAGTEVELSLCDEGLWYCELNQGKMVRKETGKAPHAEKGPADTTKALADTLNVYKAQLFVTSGHATERDWQIGFRYRNGQFRSAAGKLFGVDTQGERFPIQSDNSKVYLAVGNCLMGNINGPDAMALAWLNSAGVNQMVGYTVPTWYGYAGWGMLDYFVEQPGRFTLAEAFLANQQALRHRLTTYFPETKEPAAGKQPVRPSAAKLSQRAREAGLTPQDAQGLLYDRDTLAFYGDPAWSARMAPASLAWEQTLAVNGAEYRFEIKPLRGDKSFDTINKNGSQRGGRPIVQLLPQRIRVQDVRVTEGADLEPVIADDFLLVPLPKTCQPERAYRVVFQVKTASVP